MNEVQKVLLRETAKMLDPARVQLVEDLAEDDAELAAWGLTPDAPPDEDFRQAGQVGPKARL